MKTFIKYGITAGLISGIIFYAEFFSGISERSAGLFSLAAIVLLLIISIFLYLRRIASPELNGFYTVGYGFKKGMGLVASASAVMAIFTFIFFKFINPEYIDLLVANGIEQMRKNGVNETDIQIAATNFRSMHTPFFEAVKSMMRILAIGAFLSLIISLVVKKTS